MHSLRGDSAGGYLAVQTFLQQTHKICGAVGICPPLLGSGEMDSAVVCFFRDFKQQTGGFSPNDQTKGVWIRLSG